MKFGVREICDVVLKAKAPQKIGNKIFYKGEPVLYFDTLKTSGMEGAATTVYAQGGRGNARLMAWEGERTVTFTMEDALISPEGFMILSGAGLIESGQGNKVYQHVTENLPAVESDAEAKEKGGVYATADTLTIYVEKKPYLPTDIKRDENFAYVMLVRNGEIISEPFIPVHSEEETQADSGLYTLTVSAHETHAQGINAGEDGAYSLNVDDTKTTDVTEDFTTLGFDSVLVDYYTVHEEEGAASQIEITPDKFGGNYYLEASTLFRDTNGVDMPAEFIIPNCKIQSNFNFTMASSGDPSTFTFTMDAFPDYTRFDKTKKVLAAIQIIKSGGADTSLFRTATVHDENHEKSFI